MTYGIARTIRIQFAPLAVYDISMEGPDGEPISGRLRVTATGARRIKGQMAYFVTGVVEETGRLLRLRIAVDL